MLYLSTRVRSMLSWRAPSTGASSALEVWTMPMPGCVAAPAAGARVGVVALGGDDVRHVAADDRALGVEEQDAGLDRDRAALRRRSRRR